MADENKQGIYPTYKKRTQRPISEEDKKAIEAFQEWMKKSPEERKQIRKDNWEKEQRRKKLLKEYTTGKARNTWFQGKNHKKDTNPLKF